MGLLSGLLNPFGGGSSSFSSGGIANKESSTTQSTTNTYTDSRQVWDLGGGIVGDGNVQITNMVDGGAFDLVKTVGLAQQAAVVDLAAIQAKLASEAMQTAAAAAAQAQASATQAIAEGNARALDFAGSSAAAAFQSSNSAIGFASESFDTLTDVTRSLVKSAQQQADNAAGTAAAAYLSAADQATGNRTLILVAMAVVGLGVVVMFMRKG